MQRCFPAASVMTTMTGSCREPSEKCIKKGGNLPYFSPVRGGKEIAHILPCREKKGAQKGVFHEKRHFSEHKEGGITMAVFRIEKTRDYTVMSNHHLRNTALSLKKQRGFSPSCSRCRRNGITPQGASPVSARTALTAFAPGCGNWRNRAM